MLSPKIILTILIVFMVIFKINAWKSKNVCYKCIADAKMGPCADPFELHGRKHFQENCESDWCVKLEVGALSKNYVGTGHIERYSLIPIISRLLITVKVSIF